VGQHQIHSPLDIGKRQAADEGGVEGGMKRQWHGRLTFQKSDRN
jgi:hypothetical protein